MKTRPKTKSATRRQVQRVVSLRLTLDEAHALNLVILNGWGDGDFAGWLSDRKQIAACKRAMERLDAAIAEQMKIKADDELSLNASDHPNFFQ